KNERRIIWRRLSRYPSGRTANTAMVPGAIAERHPIAIHLGGNRANRNEASSTRRIIARDARPDGRRLDRIIAILVGDLTEQGIFRFHQAIIGQNRTLKL